MILDAPFPIDPRVSNEASALISAGHEVYLFCLSYSKEFIEKEVIDSITELGPKDKGVFSEYIFQSLQEVAATTGQPIDDTTIIISHIN